MVEQAKRQNGGFSAPWGRGRITCLSAKVSLHYFFEPPQLLFLRQQHIVAPLDRTLLYFYAPSTKISRNFVSRYPHPPSFLFCSRPSQPLHKCIPKSLDVMMTSTVLLSMTPPAPPTSRSWLTLWCSNATTATLQLLFLSR